MEGVNSMKVVTFSSLKGGVGKSSLSILTANRLGAAGYRVLVIDMDLNNSVTNYYINKETKEGIKSEKNIAKALLASDNYLADYIVLTDRRGVDLCASSLYLIDLRGMSERRLSQILPSIEDQYDVVIIDTQPTYDNLVLSAYHASDFIINPINFSQFDFNTASFMYDKLRLETDKIDNWHLSVNGYNHRFEKSTTGTQKEYEELFRSKFENLTPRETWFPWTSALRKTIDRNMFLSQSQGKDCVVHIPLFNAVSALAECFIDAETLTNVEAF